MAKSIVTDSLKAPHDTVTITTEDHVKLACWSVLYRPGDTIATKGNQGTMVMAVAVVV